MRSVFCYDGPLYKDENGNYYDSILNDQMFERYFKVATELRLIIRTRSIEGKKGLAKMNKLTNPLISVVECPNLSSISGLLSNRKQVQVIIEREIKDADLIFVRLPSVIGNLSVNLARKQRKKYLVEVVGCTWDSYWNYSLKGKIVAPFAAYMMKTRVKNAPYALYVTSKFLQKRYPSKGKTINCSNVELAVTTKEILKHRIERIDNYSENTKYIIGTAAGLDVQYKGQQYIIQALGELKKLGITCFEYQLIGGGTGEYLKMVAKECDVAEYVIFIGQIPHDKVFDWFDSIDIYAQPSRQEGLPRSVIEAMSRGLPCIGAKTAGIPELISQDYVFTNSKNEVLEICRILIEMTKSSSVMSQLAKRNFYEATKYSREILVKRRTIFFEEYRDAINEKR